MGHKRRKPVQPMRCGDTNAPLPVSNPTGTGAILQQVDTPKMRNRRWVNAIPIKRVREEDIGLCDDKHCWSAYANKCHMWSDTRCKQCHDDDVMLRMMAFQEESGINFGLTGAGGVLREGVHCDREDMEKYIVHYNTGSIAYWRKRNRKP